MINIKKVWRNNQMSIDKIEVAKEKFGKLIEEQLARVERMKADKDFIDYASLPVINKPKHKRLIINNIRFIVS